MMQKMTNLRACYYLAYNSRFIVGFGRSIAVYERESHNFIHRFSNVKNIQSVCFVGEDTIFAATGDQHFYLLSITQKNILWHVASQSNWARYGDPIIGCNQETQTVFCVVQGKASLNQHFLVSFHCTEQRLESIEIPDCLRVTCYPISISNLGCRFLHYESAGDGTLVSRIAEYNAANRSFSIVWEEQGKDRPICADAEALFYFSYSDSYEIITKRNYRGDALASFRFPMEQRQIELLSRIPLNPTTPKICGTPFGKDSLLACTSSSVYLWKNGDCTDPIRIPIDYVHYCAVVDHYLFVCTGEGLHKISL